MRIKVLLLGDDPQSLLADGQLLREKGIMVFTSFNLQNIRELINELNPDLLFFDPRKPNTLITQAYNNVIHDKGLTEIPVIFTLSEDDVYLVTRKRTDAKEKKNMMSDNIIGALKMALRSNKTYHKKTQKIPHQTIAIPNFMGRA